MFRRKSDEELWKLEQELLAAEEEEYLEEEYSQEIPDLEDLDDQEDGYEDCFESSYEEEYNQEPYYRNHANGYGQQIRNYANHYGRGNPKRFEDDDFFEEEDFTDEDVLYKKDYKRARRKKRWQNLGLTILMILELAGIAAIIALWLQWTQ